jgi:hypothetical protein
VISDRSAALGISSKSVVFPEELGGAQGRIETVGLINYLSCPTLSRRSIDSQGVFLTLSHQFFAASSDAGIEHGTTGNQTASATIPPIRRLFDE